MPLGTEVAVGLDRIVLDGDPDYPTFRRMSIMANRSPISATADLLLLCSPEEGSSYLSDVLW